MKDTDFISTIAPYAVEDMQRSQIPASLTIAQAALESAWGSSGLTERANNLFGIKGSGPSGSVTIQTTEYINGKAVRVPAAFRAYHNWGQSVSDHSELITAGVSWNRNLYSKVIGADGTTAAREIAAAGYATDPNYASKLIRIMNAYNLFQYDRMKEDGEMSAEDKQRLVSLENELKEMRTLLSGLSVSRDTLKTGVQEQGQTIKNLSERLGVMEGRMSMNVPAWAEPAVAAAAANGLLDTTTGGSYDFYRLLTVLYRAGLLVTGKEG